MKKLNGFNNGRNTINGVGGKSGFIDKSIEDVASKMNGFFQSEEYTKKRDEYNAKIVIKLDEFLFKHSYIRFGQAVIILELDKIFYEEPWVTFEKLEEKIKEIESFDEKIKSKV